MSSLEHRAAQKQRLHLHGAPPLSMPIAASAHGHAVAAVVLAGTDARMPRRSVQPKET